VKVIKVKTVGAYEVTVLSATNAANLTEWLEAHHFSFPKDKQDVLDGYVKKQWYFVAAKIDPTKSGVVLQRLLPKKEPDNTAISSSTRKKLAKGELHPLVISFPSETCVFPLAISAVNGKPSEVSLYVLSSEPLMNRMIFDKKFAAYNQKRSEWLEKEAEGLKRQEATWRERQEYIDEYNKRTGQLSEDRMKSSGSPAGDAVLLWSPWDDDPADPLPNAETRRLAVGLNYERRSPYRLSPYDHFGGDVMETMEVDKKQLHACSKAMPRLAGKSWQLTKLVKVFAPEEMRDLEFKPVIPVIAGLLGDADARVRGSACFVVGKNWETAFAPRMAELLADPDEDVRGAACYCLRRHNVGSQIPLYKKMLAEDKLAAGGAISVLETSGYSFSRKELVHCFFSTNWDVISTASHLLWGRQDPLNLKLNEIEPLLTNSLGRARVSGLEFLGRMSGKEPIERLMAMLRDPNEVVRWTARADLRHLAGQKLGSDPAAYEKWWAENKKDFKPRP
jgi:HEAT repeat protein